VLHQRVSGHMEIFWHAAQTW